MAGLSFGSLFAGIGGFDLGLERSSMIPKWQVLWSRFGPAIGSVLKNDTAILNHLHGKSFQVLVDGHVRRAGADKQILSPIVALDAIDVMDDLIGCECPAKHLLSHKYVLRSVRQSTGPVGRSDHDIAPLVSEPASRTDTASIRTLIALAHTLAPPMVAMPAERLVGDAQRARYLSQRFSRLQAGF